ASALPLFPSLSVGDVTALAVFGLFALVSLRLLHMGGRLRLAEIAAMGAIGLLAVGYLLGLGLSVGGLP
ncbi:MAG: hypothetical protein JNJ46_22940, partial [Myxococcales bacterium]|nr:hypothetical protein [Myxococcales bacterium]